MIWINAKMPTRESISVLVSIQYISENQKKSQNNWVNECTYINEIYEVSIWAVHQSIEVFVSRHPYLATGIRCNHWVVVVIKEDLSSRGLDEDRSWRDSFDFHHECHVVFLILTWEEWISNVEFIENTSKAPHINSSTIGNAENNFGSPIESGLDIRINLLVFKTSTTKINDLNTRLVDLSKQDVLWLEITVDNIVLVEKV